MKVGRISSPLGVIHLGQDTRLVVTPWAAMGTDALLIGTGLIAMSCSRHIALKIVGIAGTAWGSIALAVEALKLAQAPDMKIGVNQAEIVRQR